MNDYEQFIRDLVPDQLSEKPMGFAEHRTLKMLCMKLDRYQLEDLFEAAAAVEAELLEEAARHMYLQERMELHLNVKNYFRHIFGVIHTEYVIRKAK